MKRKKKKKNVEVLVTDVCKIFLMQKIPKTTKYTCLVM